MLKSNERVRGINANEPWNWLFSNPNISLLGYRGDVVIVRSPEDPKCLICKRIAAMVCIHLTHFRGNVVLSKNGVPCACKD